MSKPKLIALFTAILVCIGSSQGHAQRIDTSRTDGLKIQSPTRVQAGKYFQAKLVSMRGKISGVCWWDWQATNGFTGPSNFRMKNGSATVKILPIQPGPGRMTFYCGKNRSEASIGGFSIIYIAP